MIPLIERETVDRREWVKKEDILEIIAVAESTPGPIAINAATCVGYKIAGFFGALAATFGVVLPSFLIILAVTFLLDRFSSLTAVRYAFIGIRAGVLALILKALLSMYKSCPKSVVAYIINTFKSLNGTNAPGVQYARQNPNVQQNTYNQQYPYGQPYDTRNNQQPQPPQNPPTDRGYPGDGQ